MKDFLSTLLVFLVGIMLGAVLFDLATISHYKQGQIDCVQGKVNYQLVTQENGETKWEQK